MQLNEDQKVVVKNWVEDLRSGKFTQTKGALERTEPHQNYAGDVFPTGFCCLGVLCRRAVSESIVQEVDTHLGRVEFDGNSGFLPESVRNWSGLEGSPQVTWNGGKEDLSVLNDRDGLSFNEIADLIEKEFLNV